VATVTPSYDTDPGYVHQNIQYEYLLLKSMSQTADICVFPAIWGVVTGSHRLKESLAKMHRMEVKIRVIKAQMRPG
jgi:hypothetical protein